MGAAAVPIFSAVASTLVGGLVSKAFEKKPEKVPEPKVETPTVMPDPMAQKAAMRRKAALSMSQQMGASDTVLTGGDTKLGA